MKAVILAAGVGSRLRDLTKDKPKCMLPVFNDTLLVDYQIEVLKEFGISERNIFIIGGHKVDALKNHLKDKNVSVIFNSKFRDWNNIYSFYMIKAIKKISDKDDFILLNSDTFFNKNILKYLLDYKHPNSVVVDSFKKLGNEEMKVLTVGKRVIKFGKDISPDIAKGEYIGLAKFRKIDLEPLFNTIEFLIKEGKTDIWYEIAFNYVLDKIDVGYTDTRGKPWIEIDDIKDYQKAKKLNIVL